MKPNHIQGCILFDWGDTLMRDLKNYQGPMKDWPVVEAVPGASSVLSKLHSSWTICLATNAENSSEEDIWVALNRVNLGRWLERIYCYKNIGHKKPAADFYLHIINDLMIPPEFCTMIGDDYEKDVSGAAACGMRAIWFNETGMEERCEPRIRTIHSLLELPRVLSEWKNTDNECTPKIL